MSTPGAPVLEVTGIVGGYGAIRILNGVDLEVRAGEIVAVLGPNGAGKSTTLKACFGLVRVTAGTVRFVGDDITNRPPHDLVRRGMALLPQGGGAFPSLTVLENLAMGAFTRKDRHAVPGDIAEMQRRFPVLKAREDTRAGNLSGGEQQLLALARALLSRPRLLLLDEPTLGLSPKNVGALSAAITAVREEGIPVLLVEQNARLALEIADRAYVLEQGRVRLDGTARELRQDPRLVDLYLGGAAGQDGGAAAGGAMSRQSSVAPAR